MGNRFLHRRGDAAQVLVPIDSATVINIGDLVVLSSGKAIPAASVTWDTNLATTQEAMHDGFIGVAMEQSRAGDTADISVATGGEVEFDCASASFALGALVGCAKQSGNAIENQKVVSVATANLAIGRVVRVYTSVTKVVVRIQSVVLMGGPQAMA